MSTNPNIVSVDRAVQLQAQGHPFGVSYGMGTDSTAMLVEMRRRDIFPDFIIFANTGCEKPLTYAYKKAIEVWCKRNGFPNPTWVRRHATESRSGRGTYKTLEENMILHGTLPSLAFGRKGKCSGKWKVEVMRKWERSAYPEVFQDKDKVIIKAIGYDAGPKDSGRGTSAIFDGNYLYTYPLRDWGLDRAKCSEIIKAARLPDPGKSACFFCPASTPDDIRQLCVESPDLARRIVLMEYNAEPGLTALKGLWGSSHVKGFRNATKKPPTISELIAGERLLPEFEEYDFLIPWWLGDEVVDDNPNDGLFSLKWAWSVVKPHLRSPLVDMAVREDYGSNSCAQGA